MSEQRKRGVRKVAKLRMDGRITIWSVDWESFYKSAKHGNYMFKDDHGNVYRNPYAKALLHKGGKS